MMKKILAWVFIFFSLSYSYGTKVDRHYTEREFQNSIAAGAFFSASDVFKLISYQKGHRGNFYDYALQGTFIDAIRFNKKAQALKGFPQWEIIQELYDREVSKQDFKQTLEGIKKLLSGDTKNYSPSVIAFCLIVEIMANKKNLENSDLEFFVDFYQKTDNKILQHAIYTAILNGKNAIEHKNVILKSGNYLDIYYLLISMIRATRGGEQEIWKKQLKALKAESPVLEKQINFFFEHEL